MEALMLALYVSDLCHRHCDHCYRSHGEQVMSLPVAKDIANWISNICVNENVQNLNISFLGGEPTNNIVGIFHFIDQLRKNLDSRFSSVHIFDQAGIHLRLFTNGDLLTDDMLRELKRHKVVIMLNPTYDTLSDIEAKIQYIRAICGGCNMAIALNDFNMNRLSDLTGLAIKHGCHIRTNRLYDGGNIHGYVESYESAMHEMFDLLMEASKPMWPNWIMESTYPTWRGPKNPYSCGRWFVAIDPDGTIRSCNPDPDTRVGSIYTHQWRDISFPHRWSAKHLPECQDCEWITWCQGGCPYTRKLTYGTYNHKSPFCSAFKTLFPKLMQLRDKWESYCGKT